MHHRRLCRPRRRCAGTDLGFSDWLEITQDRIDTFADATDDHQWIHVDPERANGRPVRRADRARLPHPVAGDEVLDRAVRVEGVTTKVNYGLDKVRFVSPVTVGSRVRMNAVIAEVTEVKGGYQLAVDQTIEIEGGAKPAVVARGLYRFYA